MREIKPQEQRDIRPPPALGADLSQMAFKASTGAVPTTALSGQMLTLLNDRKGWDRGATFARVLHAERSSVPEDRLTAKILECRAALRDAVRCFLLQPRELTADEVAAVGSLFRDAAARHLPIDRLARLNPLAADLVPLGARVPKEQRHSALSVGTVPLIAGIADALEADTPGVFARSGAEQPSKKAFCALVTAQLFERTYPIGSTMANEYFGGPPRPGRHLTQFRDHERLAKAVLKGSDWTSLQQHLRGLTQALEDVPADGSAEPDEVAAYHLLRSFFALADKIPIMRSEERGRNHRDLVAHAFGIVRTFADVRQLDR